MDKEIYIIDGDHFDDLHSFYDEISRVLIPGVEWGRNFLAFIDILRGGFGTPAEYVLIWKHADRSRKLLGYHFGERKHLPVRKPKIRQPPGYKAWLVYDFQAYGQNIEYDQTIYELLVEAIERQPNIDLRLE